MINVSNIERFATHDGPGIRTTVFLKGCPLHCPWCANPETWTTKSVLMYKENLCVGCRECEKHCPRHAITWTDTFHVDRTKCITCGTCLNHCIPSALSINGTMMAEEDIIKEVLRDREYYEESGGGVTFSGGEPLFQQDSIPQLLRLAKQAGLHVAVETTGYYNLEFLKSVEEYIDLFLFDIKQLDREKLAAVTGAKLQIIADSFGYLTEHRPQDVIARIPVIPNFNENDLEQMIAFALEHHVQAVNLLPYHTLGKSKWEQMQKQYGYGTVPMMDKEILSKYIRNRVTIGG